MMPNLLQYPIALFGALRGGFAVVNVNPLYTAGGLLFAGLGLVASSWFLLAAAALALLLVRLRLPREEAELEARFGDRYRDYARRTGRFVPRLRR